MEMIVPIAMIPSVRYQFARGGIVLALPAMLANITPKFEEQTP
ncbi:hypothetical protein FHS76_003109 [Ochrobactrum daejeonense]|uniref:Uncharacterized protein n=1 Tax=Brucella daejeonensis TaxID=659015 RepID=A0A7W9EM92_9HYPH|nr:hypothetical protein [Brucella daejeonensis]MBB5703213.1 hypothetical protein [Brucella daejeonensis]